MSEKKYAQEILQLKKEIAGLKERKEELWKEIYKRVSRLVRDVKSLKGTQS